MEATQKDIKANKYYAAVGYLGILCLVPLLMRRDSTYAMHHGKQGLMILLVWVVLWFGNIIPILGQIAWFLGSIALLILVVLGILNSLNGKMWSMPLLGAYAKKLEL